MTDFARRLTLFDLVLIATGASIGSGIFRSPSEVAAAMPSPAWMLGAWALGGAITLAGALAFAELGAAMPRAGGMYVWLSEAYGALVGFLFGWAYFLVVATGAIAALAIVFAEYAGSFLVPSGASLGPSATKGIALAALVALAAVNVVGVRAAAALGDVLTILKLVALAAIVLLAFAFGGAPRGNPTWGGPAPGGAALAEAMIGILWAYGGWHHASFAAGEARRPARDVPLGMVLGSVIVTLFYLLANVAYLRLLPVDAMARSPHLASDAAEVAIGRVGSSLVGGAIALSALGTAGLYTMTTPRMYWAMAERGLFFRGVAELHPRWRTPVRAILLQTAWAAVLVVAWGTFEKLVSYVLIVDWVFFGLAAAAVFVLRRRATAKESTYRSPGYPFLPAAFVAVSAWFVAATLWGQPLQGLAGCALLAMGVPVYRVWSRLPRAAS